MGISNFYPLCKITGMRKRLFTLFCESCIESGKTAIDFSRIVLSLDRFERGMTLSTNNAIITMKLIYLAIFQLFEPTSSSIINAAAAYPA